MIIWSFFDSENDTVKNVIRSVKLFSGEVFSFGLGSGNTHIPLDLSDSVHVLRRLEDYPEPDMIFAFPPCQTWLSVSAGSCRKVHREPGMTLYWKSRWEPFRKPASIVNRRLNGSLCALSVAKIISRFKPSFWFIENPSHSQLFNFLEDKCGLRGARNRADYLSYGFPVHKPTTVYSNVVLPLRRTPRKYAAAKVFDLPASDRVKVPPKLIGHIIECASLNMFERAFTV